MKKKLLNFKKFLCDNKRMLLILFLISLITYGYAGTNNIINIDGIKDFIIINKPTNFNYYLVVGRWGWGVAGLLFNFYPSYFICLIINSILFSISGLVLCKMFNLKKNIHIIIVSCILIAFPINIGAYLYAPWQYIIGLCYLSSILSLYIIKNYKNKYDILIASLLFSFSISMYQMFLCFIITGCVLLLIVDYMNEINIKDFFKKAFLYLIYGVLGLFIYYIILKVLLFVFNANLSDYQGASSLFNINVRSILNNFFNTFVLCFKVHLGTLSNKLIDGVINIVVVLCFLSCIIKLKPSRYFAFIVLFVLLLMAPRSMAFLKTDAFYHCITLISYSMFVCGCIIILLINVKNIRLMNYFVIFILLLCSFEMIIKANNNFVIAKQVTDCSFAYLNRIQYKIESFEEYDSLREEKKYYIINKNEDFYSEFPSSFAYMENSVVTWTFLQYDESVISAFNVLGINVINAKDYLSDDEIHDIKIRVFNGEELFIYKDVVVIVLE